MDYRHAGNPVPFSGMQEKSRRATRVRRSRYTVEKVYLISCETCNEDITRTLTGEDVTTLAEAEQAIRDHEEVFHPGRT